jgi:hypothetical protein
MFNNDSRRSEETTPNETGGYQMPRTPFGASTFINSAQEHTPHPTERVHWAIQFRGWLAERWFDSNCSIPCLSPGPNAKNPTLLPLIKIARASGVFDFSDTTTYLFWLEFLSEHPKRLKFWRQFERANGPCEALYWENDAGRFWELTHAVKTPHSKEKQLKNDQNGAPVPPPSNDNGAKLVAIAAQLLRETPGLRRSEALRLAALQLEITGDRE